MNKPNPTHCLILGRRAVLAAVASCVAGCATTSWHEDTMNNQQLIQASCQSLTVEEAKLADNAKHLTEASRTSTFGTVLLAALEAMAGTSGDAAVNQASLADDATTRSRKLEERLGMVRALRAKKGCPA